MFYKHLKLKGSFEHPNISHHFVTYSHNFINNINKRFLLVLVILLLLCLLFVD